MTHDVDIGAKRELSLFSNTFPDKYVSINVIDSQLRQDRA